MKPFSMKLFFNQSAAVILLFMMALVSSTASADGKASLERFFTQVHTLTARFQQVILDEGLNPIDQSSGMLRLVRPGRFRWDYDAPQEQHIISDGKKVWLYDVELAQVTVRRVGPALGKTPALILAGEGDLKQSFTIKDMGQQGRLQWVQLEPKQQEEFNTIRLGFEGANLRLLEMVDGLGQITRITLSNPLLNRNLDPQLFRFTVPAGADVIDETQSQ